MQELLCALNHCRSAGFLGDVHLSLDPEQPGAKVLRNPVQQELCFLACERTLAGENDALDSFAFEVAIVRMPRVIMFVMIMIGAASVVNVRGLLVRLDIQPGTGIRVPVGGVEARIGKES